MIPICKCTNTYEEAVSTRSLSSNMNCYVSPTLSDVNESFCRYHYKHNYGLSRSNHHNDSNNNGHNAYSSKEDTIINEDEWCTTSLSMEMSNNHTDDHSTTINASLPTEIDVLVIGMR
jgi:hypothetical protein